MKFIQFSLLLSTLLFVGCSTTPELTEQPIEIEGSELENYWQSSAFEFRIPMPGPQGKVKLRYLIDSEGDVHNVQVISYDPSEDWVVVGKRALGNVEYTPAPQNTTRQPVIVETEFTFNHFTG